MTWHQGLVNYPQAFADGTFSRGPQALEREGGLGSQRSGRLQSCRSFRTTQDVADVVVYTDQDEGL